MLYFFVVFALAGTNQPNLWTLRASAKQAYDAKDYGSCAKLFGRAAVLPDELFLAEDEYNASRCFALGGEVKNALAHLRLAVKNGFRDVEKLESEQAFQSIHEDTEWKASLANAKTNSRLHDKSTNAELAQLFKEDQQARQGTTPNFEGDPARLARVKQIIAQGGAKVADDFFHAAMVYQHGSTPADFEQAHRLALRAVKLNPRNSGRAKWLAAAAKDRWLRKLGKPQLYGTQFQNNSGVYTIQPFDPSVTDDERSRWNVQPLEEARKHIQHLNASGTKVT